MPRRIEEDHAEFIDVYSGRIRKELKKFINNGKFFRNRGDGKKVIVTVPKMDIPFIVYGDNGTGVGRGPGKPGDVIKKDKEKGKGKGKGGQEEGEGVDIAVSMEYVLKLLKDELQLPDLKKKPNELYEEIKIKYNSISVVGPESLRHMRKTMMQAMKRMAASGELGKLQHVPGLLEPIPLITPINEDRRYRQYREIKLPSSNAVIFFARDGSGSMDQFKCDIASDMAWWIDLWIRSFYERTERVYVWHDTNAIEVDEEKFYKHRYGGGTTCSSAFNFIAKQFDSRYPPSKWNIYVIYFTDGENGEENSNLIDVIKKQMPESVVNFIGITQIMSHFYDGSVKQAFDNVIKEMPNLKTTSVGEGQSAMSEDELNMQIKKAIIDLLGKGSKNVK